MVEKIIKVLNELSKPVKGSRIFILGVAYKKDISDYRESPAIKIINQLSDCVVIVTDYTAIDYQMVVEKANVVLDTRNATKDVRQGRNKIILI